LSFFVHVPSGCTGPLSGGDANGGNKDDTFLFSVGSNGLPSFHSSYNLPGGCTDEFHNVPNTWPQQFVVSQMCDDVGNSPGGLILFTVPSSNSGTATFSTWGFKAGGAAFTYADNYNPHGGDWSNSWGFIISDFVWPASLLNYNTRQYLDANCGEALSGSPLTFRNTVRLFGVGGWSGAAAGIQQRVWTMPGWGYIATKFIYRGFAISAGTVPSYLGGDNTLYMIDSTCTQTPTHSCLTVAYDFAATYGPAFSVGLPYVDTENRRILIAYGMQWAVLLQYSVSNGVPVTPFTKVWDYNFGTIAGATDDQYPFPNTQGSHYVRVDRDLYSWGSRFVVVNSFVDFPVNKGTANSFPYPYECTESGGGPLGTDWPNCPGTVDGGVATFFCNFHGGRSAASFTFGSNGLPGANPTSTFTFNGAAPHSVVLASRPDN